MIDSNSSLIVAAIFGVLGVVLGAVTSSMIKDAMERKNKLLQAYSQLIGKKFAITQSYTNLLGMSLFVYNAMGLKQESENQTAQNRTVPDREKQIRELEEVIEYNKEKMEKTGPALIKDIESFWKIIGIINSINSNRNNDESEDKLIEDIKLKQNSLDKMQKEWINETNNGLPGSKPDANNVLVSPWREGKKLELERRIELLEEAIDSLIEYIKKNKINKHWLEFLF